MIRLLTTTATGSPEPTLPQSTDAVHMRCRTAQQAVQVQPCVVAGTVELTMLRDRRADRAFSGRGAAGRLGCSSTTAVTALHAESGRGRAARPAGAPALHRRGHARPEPCTPPSRTPATGGEHEETTSWHDR